MKYLFLISFAISLSAQAGNSQICKSFESFLPLENTESVGQNFKGEIEFLKVVVENPVFLKTRVSEMATKDAQRKLDYLLGLQSSNNQESMKDFMLEPGSVYFYAEALSEASYHKVDRSLQKIAKENKLSEEAVLKIFSETCPVR